MVSERAIEQFEENDVELTVPLDEPRPVLIIVMVSSTAFSYRHGSSLLL